MPWVKKEKKRESCPRRRLFLDPEHSKVCGRRAAAGFSHGPERSGFVCFF